MNIQILGNIPENLAKQLLYQKKIDKMLTCILGLL